MYSIHIGSNSSEPLTRCKIAETVSELIEYANNSEALKNCGYVICTYVFSDLHKRWISEKVITEKKGKRKCI